MRQVLWGSVLGAALFSGQALAQDQAGWADQADALLATHWSQSDPGVSVIVTQNGQVIYSGVAGSADLDAGHLVTEDTVFRLGSITKQFAAAITLQLVAEGQLSLDATVADFLPDYPQPGASATVRQLLNHTSGIQSYTSIPGWMTEANTNQSYTTAELIAEFSDYPANFQPGDAWAYNNSGYVLLGAVIEVVTGQLWSEVVRERISEPLGLETLQSGEFEAGVDTMARGYTLNPEDGVVPSNLIHMSVPHAAGNLIADAADMAVWGNALHSGEVVSTALYQEMITPTALPDGEIMSYGYGLSFDELRGQATIEHGGGIFGFSTDSVYVPDEDLYVVVLTNSDEPVLPPSLVSRRVAALALGSPYPVFTEVALDLDAVAPFFGRYQIEGTEDTRDFYETDGQLYTHRSGGSPSEVWSVGEGRFYYGSDSLTWFEIVPDANGAHVMNMHQQGATEASPAVWREPVPEAAAIIELPADTKLRYVGAYSLGGGVLTISSDADHQLQAQLTGQPALDILPIGETEFLVSGVDARLVFTVTAGGVSGVTLYQGPAEIFAERQPD